MKRMLYAFVNYVTVMFQIFFVKSDVFWVANCPDILAVPLILRRKPYILEYRSPWSLEVEKEFGFRPLFHLVAKIERLVLGHARIITLTTSRLMERVRRFGKRIFVIPNYPLKDFGKVTSSKEELCSKVGCRKDEKIVLFVGKLSRVEGADLLIDLIETMLEESGVVFWIVGDGPFYPSLKETAEKYPEKVKLYGWQPHEKIPSFIAASDVCIAPRHKSPFSGFYNEEGLQKVSEYMFFQKPIVACGMAESQEYLLVAENKLAEGVLKAIKGHVRPSSRKVWEDHCEEKVYEMLNLFAPEKT